MLNLSAVKSFEGRHRQIVIMPETAFSKDALKEALKEALVETLAEQQDLLRAVIAEVLEDLVFGEAMREGESTEVVDRARIFDLLENKV